MSSSSLVRSERALETARVRVRSGAFGDSVLENAGEGGALGVGSALVR